MPAGSICWGHVTGVTQDNVHTFTGNWTGTGSAGGAEDLETMCVTSPQYMESEVVYTDTFVVRISQNTYRSGDTVKIQYRHGATEADCLSASWNDYVSQFISLGYIQLRMEETP